MSEQQNQSPFTNPSQDNAAPINVNPYSMQGSGGPNTQNPYMQQPAQNPYGVNYSNNPYGNPYGNPYQAPYGTPGGMMPNNMAPAPEPKKKGSFLGGFITAMVVCLITVMIGVGIAAALQRGSTLPVATEYGTTTLTVEEANALVAKVDKLARYIQNYYVEEVDVDTLLDGAYHGVVNAIEDKYAAYYNEEELADFQDSSYGEYVGIGVTVMLDDTGIGGALVMAVNQNGCAYEMGIEPGDVLIEADGVSLAGKTLNEMVSYIRGEAGTYVSITYMRNGVQNTVSIERRALKETAVYYTMMENKIGYIALADFTVVAVDQFDYALKDLQSQGMQGLILDIRDNGGGLVDVCVDIADEMIDTGLVTYMEDKYGDREEYKARNAGELDMPIVILINGNTASASELLTTCLIDYGKAVTVGTLSYGKGIVQTTYNLMDGTAVKMTTAKYYSPLGTNVQGIGITPDYEVEMAEDVVLSKIKTNGIPDLTQDLQLQKAIEVMLEQMKGR